MKEVREQLEKKMQGYQAEKIHDETFSLMKKIFGEKEQEDLLKDFESEMVKKGRVPERMLNVAKELSQLRGKVKAKNLTYSEMQRFSRDATDLTNALTEYSQRKELVSMEKGIMQITYKGDKAEIVATDEGVFVVERNKIRKVENGKLIDVDRKIFEQALKNTKERLKFNLSSEVIDTLKKELGEFVISF